MIRKAYLFVSLFAFSLTRSMAQDAIVDSMSAQNFSGVTIAPMTRVAYSYCTVTEKDKTFLKGVLFDPKLKVSGNFKYAVPKGAYVLASAFVERGFVFIIADPASRTRTTLALDISGRLIAQNVEKGVAADVLINDKTYYIGSAMPMGVLTIVPVSSREYKMTSYDQEMKVSWSKEIKADQGDIVLNSVEPMMERLVLVGYETQNKTTKGFLKMLNTGDGRFMREIDLTRDDDNIIPSVFKFAEGMTVLGGEYYNSKEKKQVISGIVGELLSPDGNVMKSAKVSFENLSKFLPDAQMQLIKNNDAKIVVTGVCLSEPQDIALICELVTRNPQSSTVSINNPMIIQVSEEGEIKSLKSIPNVNEIKAEIKNEKTFNNDNALTQWLLKEQLFHIRGTLRKGRNNYLYYADYDSVDTKFKAIPINDVVADKIIELPMLPIASANLKKTKLDQVFNATPAATGDPYKWQFSNIVLMQPGPGVVIYELEKDKLKIKSIENPIPSN
ncbi:MAG: hypothetical protein JST70_09580 [Bacteroidetes bacterium]|nr:hypothetical protein [Bacteroidota bacterium]